MTPEKHEAHSRRGNAATVSLMSDVPTRFARLGHVSATPKTVRAFRLSHLHADVVHNGCELKHLSDSRDVPPGDEYVLVANDSLEGLVSTLFFIT